MYLSLNNDNDNDNDNANDNDHDHDHDHDHDNDNDNDNDHVRKSRYLLLDRDKTIIYCVNRSNNYSRTSCTKHLFSFCA